MISSVVNVVGCIFEAIIIFMLFDTYVEKSEESPKSSYFISVALLSSLIVLSNKVLNLGLFNVVFVAFAIFVVMYAYNKNKKMNLILSIVSVVILTVSELIVALLTVTLTGIEMSMIGNIPDYHISGAILSKLIAFFVMKFFCVIHKKENSLMVKTSYWFLLLMMFLSSGMSIFLIFRFQYESNITKFNIASVVCSFGLLYSTFFAFYLYEKLSTQAKIEQKQEMFQQQIKAQSKHLDEILITQRKIKKIRHDLANHNISIQKFFEEGDCKSGLEYMKNINEFADVPAGEISTGNAAFDAIINTKKSIAQSKGVDFSTNIQIPEDIFVEPVDICIIFGNALDNCIEACERLDNGEKWISVSIVYEDDSLICKISNSAQKSISGFLKTEKKDVKNHGFGIENIESALSKYKHIFRFRQDEQEFQLSFVIFKG